MESLYGLAMTASREQNPRCNNVRGAKVLHGKRLLWSAHNKLRNSWPWAEENRRGNLRPKRGSPGRSTVCLAVRSAITRNHVKWNCKYGHKRPCGTAMRVNLVLVLTNNPPLLSRLRWPSFDSETERRMWGLYSAPFVWRTFRRPSTVRPTCL